ncbi:MAG TPA: HAD family phosphatase [Bryobacteraceae bacterium]|nr:HAD family phosphatase [Bryobacteraceae bacterium]
MSIRAVIFDFGNVVCFPPTEEQWAEAAQFCGVNVADFKRVFWLTRDDYDRGEDSASYWLNFAKMHGRTFDGQMIAGLVRREIALWRNFDGRVLAWTDALRAAGIRTGLLSNLPLPLAEALRAAPGFLDHFDQVTFSCEFGFIKPHPEIYRKTIEELQIAPAEGLFIDDRPQNIEGALAVGLRVELFTTWEEFCKRDHRRYGLPQPPS